jgi:hypothetical protein
MKYSIVVCTNRPVGNIDSLRSLFTVSHKDAELIIIDSNYNSFTFDELKKMQHGFGKVVYAPPKKRDGQYLYDQISALNTGYAYAEGDWTMRMDDFSEFKPDFFERLEEDIEYFSKDHGKRFIIRQLELESNMGDVRWESFHKNITERYHRVPPGPLRNGIPMITSGIFFCHRDVIIDLNGFDERYDLNGIGWNDNDMFFRALTAGHPIFYDLQLMIYRSPHVSTAPQDRQTNQLLFFSIGENEFKKGEYTSKNPFTMEELSESLKSKKSVYEV